MFFFTKFAFVTCAVYLGIAILFDGAIFCVARWKGFSFFVKNGTSVLPVGLVFFSAIWLLAFLISWRIVMTPLLARMFARINGI
jgi:hypothetical protein